MAALALQARCETQNQVQSVLECAYIFAITSRIPPGFKITYGIRSVPTVKSGVIRFRREISLLN